MFDWVLNTPLVCILQQKRLTECQFLSNIVKVSSMLQSHMGHFKSKLKKMKKDTTKKILTFLEMEFSSHNIKNILIFSQKKALLKFREIELFRKWNFLSLRLKNFLYFQKRNFLASYFPYISGRNSPSSKNSKNTQGTCKA